MTKSMITLAPEARRLAGRIAAELFRTQIWATAASLREEALERLRGGASEASVAGWLEGQLQAALKTQADRV